jgi:hypothetical protein
LIGFKRNIVIKNNFASKSKMCIKIVKVPKVAKVAKSCKKLHWFSLVITEELSGLIPMHGRTTSDLLYNEVIRCMENLGLSEKNLYGCVTDGTPSMIAKKRDWLHC